MPDIILAQVSLLYSKTAQFDVLILNNKFVITSAMITHNTQVLYCTMKGHYYLMRPIFVDEMVNINE